MQWTTLEISRLSRALGLQCELETVTDLDGELRRFWFFLTDKGQPLVGGEGAGLKDEAALEFLRVHISVNTREGKR
jgi:hypothetical protein